jgi:RNA polymerase sigma-70 factor, ECF subfamily
MQNSAEQIIDQILVMDAQSGHSEAFDALISRWQKRLWWRAYSLTAHTEAAWDITQESWLDIVRGLSRLNDSAKFGAWAYRIVSNKARDWLRRNGRWHSADIESEDLCASTDDQGKHETAADVHDILRRLPIRSQEVLKLYYFDALGLAEVARILDVPEGTVKSRLHTARAEFRNYWESLGDISLASIPPFIKEDQHE